jgi:uncharacterized membrane protein YfcA
MIAYLGYFGALLIGLILGLTGGGGSILTVPVLVYVMGLNPVVATAYSLFIVGTTSAFGTIQNFKKGVVEIKTGLQFAIPSLVAVYLTRKFIVPAIPEILFHNTHFTLTKDTFLMVLFAVVMLFASLSMLKTKKGGIENTIPKNNNLLLVIGKLFSVGILIGLIGAGGGFLIIPALFFIAHLPMRKAIGTSLLIIAINSLIGFTGDIGNIMIDWNFLLGFTTIAIIGIYIGIYLSKFIRESRLKKGFGWFVLAMAVFILTKEIFF